MTLTPRRRAPLATSTGTAVVRCEGEVVEDHLSEARHPLDEHGLPLAVRPHDLGVERHRQFDQRIEPGIRAIAREHLLDRDP